MTYLLLFIIFTVAIVLKLNKLEPSNPRIVKGQSSFYVWPPLTKEESEAILAKSVDKPVPSSLTLITPVTLTFHARINHVNEETNKE